MNAVPVGAAFFAGRIKGTYIVLVFILAFVF